MLEGRGFVPRGRSGWGQLIFLHRDPVSLQLSQTHGSGFTVGVGPTPVVVLSGFRAVKRLNRAWSLTRSSRPLTPLFRDLFGERGKAVFLLGG